MSRGIFLVAEFPHRSDSPFGLRWRPHAGLTNGTRQRAGDR